MESVQPNMLHLLNLHTLIYNKSKSKSKSKFKSTNLLENVDFRVLNDTSDIQEALNTLMVEHLNLDKLNNSDVYIDLDDFDLDADIQIYALILDSKPISYSASRFALLIYGSNLIAKEGYKDYDIIKI